ncbi:hypothetical protein K2173_011635 [Erythroxylum novogranatense]|uniref:C2H2-type domain-containing protein n=1 Tax=Erythroxylum novogranatense TaxID=1862640 RepID=A0AAV8U4Z7_9ROSI|nr:hypothetical protein K2173_011635 [Erythroxylum novogranatense]
MYNEDQSKPHTSGHEGHGVHVCQKCGWPFPNPHPSAKHRRAHKKICGTIEGYKLDGSQGAPHLTISDDEHSDADQKSHSPKILERNYNEKGSGAIGESSSRSEYDVFADAAAEFSDIASSPGIEESPEDLKKSGSHVKNIAENDGITIQSDEDGVIQDDFQVIASLPSKSDDNTEVKSSEVPLNKLSGSAEATENHISTAVIDLVERPLTDSRSEASACEGCTDEGGSVSDSNFIKSEIQTIKKSEKSDTSEDLTENVLNQNEDANSDVKVLEVIVLPVEYGKEAPDLVSGMEKTQHTISNNAHTMDVIQLEKEKTEESKPTSYNQSPEVKCVDFVEESVATTQIKVDVGEGADSINSSNSIDLCNVKGEANKNMHVFSVPVDLPVDNASLMNEGLKDHKEGSVPQVLIVDSSAVGNDIKNSIPEGNSSPSIANLLTEGTDIYILDLDIKDKHEDKGQIEKPMLEVLPSEGASEVPQVAPKINENNQPIASKTVESESTIVQPPCENEIDLSVRSLEENMVKDLSGVNPEAKPTDPDVWRTANLVGNDPCDYEKTTNEKYDSDGNNDSQRSTEKIITPEVNASAILLGMGNATSCEENQIEIHDVPIIATGENDCKLGLSVGTLAKTTVIAKSASDHHETCIHEENPSDKSGLKPSVSEGKCIIAVQDAQESTKEFESNANDKIELENPVGISAVVGSDNGEDVEALEKSSEDCMTKGPLISGSDTSVSIHNAANIDNKPSRHVASETPKSLPGEGDNNLDTNSVPRQLGSSAIDLSVDSSSQTDSLEGHWGSVSVLSTQSDIPAAVDTEPFPLNDSQASTFADESSFKKSGAAPEEQQNDKSEVFEPPSFMTLVEPRPDTKATTDSEIQTNRQAKVANVQAGWFPSLTHVVNESQGRKKNEEIIAKVANWSYGKQHAPLKSLLNEATVESKSKLPNTKENPSTTIQNGGTLAKDNSASPTSLPSDAPNVDSSKNEAEKEWNSPARYPANIKRERRRPYWAQFMCCSSVN